MLVELFTVYVGSSNISFSVIIMITVEFFVNLLFIMNGVLCMDGQYCNNFMRVAISSNLTLRIAM